MSPEDLIQISDGIMALRFEKTAVEGSFLVQTSPFRDDRGTFERVFCAREFASFGLCKEFVQVNTSRNTRVGTMRGLHAQISPHEEVKVVSCQKGAIYDVVVDVRVESPTFRRWYGVELNENNGMMLYVPEGCAHGYLTLSPESTVTYLVSRYYVPNAEQGFHFADPAFGIEWPIPIEVISAKDANWPPMERF